MLPNIEDILHFSEENLLQTEVQHSVKLQHLDDIVERATCRGYTQGLDVSKVVNALRSRGIDHSPSSGTWNLGIVVLAGLGILRLIWFKSTSKYCPCILRTECTHVASDQRLNEGNIGFQVEPGRSEENSEVTSEEASRNQLQPTVFVQHGRMVADHP